MSGFFLTGLGDFYVKKYRPLANSTTYKNIIGEFLLGGACIQIGLFLTLATVNNWWHKRYPPRPESTDSPVGAPPSPGDTDATDYSPPT